MWHGNWHGIGRELDVGELGGRERERERDLERRELFIYEGKPKSCPNAPRTRRMATAGGGDTADIQQQPPGNLPSESGVGGEDGVQVSKERIGLAVEAAGKLVAVESELEHLPY